MVTKCGLGGVYYLSVLIIVVYLSGLSTIYEFYPKIENILVIMETRTIMIASYRIARNFGGRKHW